MRKMSNLGTPAGGAAVSVDLRKCGEAALAQRGVIRALAYVRGIIPATFALRALGALGEDLKSLEAGSGHRALQMAFRDFNLRHNEEPRQVCGIFAQQI